MGGQEGRKEGVSCIGLNSVNHLRLSLESALLLFDLSERLVISPFHLPEKGVYKKKKGVFCTMNP